LAASEPITEAALVAFQLGAYQPIEKCLVP
jgi:hypothetical protein